MSPGAVRVGRWAPAIHVSAAVPPAPELDTLRHRAPAGYDAPGIRFAPPQGLLVEGGSFVALAERDGLVGTYLARDFSWPRLLTAPDGTPLRPIAADGPVLVCGNAVARNYYHWLWQCVAAALFAPPGRLLVPRLRPWQHAVLALAGIDPGRLAELDTAAVAALPEGVHGNLTGGDFAFAPHPVVAAALAARAAPLPPSPWRGARVYVARTDAAGRRPLRNEPALIAALRARGFAIVEASALPVPDQAALFRDAALLVAPHGAALANLAWAAAPGPIVVELLQAGYLNRCFTRIAQVKGLRYAATINPEAGGGAWDADIPLLHDLLDARGA